jgi:hypothetical protein
VHYQRIYKVAGVVISVDGKRVKPESDCQGYFILYPEESTVFSGFEDRNCIVPFQFIETKVALDQSEMEQSRQQQTDLKLPRIIIEYYKATEAEQEVYSDDE